MPPLSMKAQSLILSRREELNKYYEEKICQTTAEWPFGGSAVSMYAPNDGFCAGDAGYNFKSEF